MNKKLIKIDKEFSQLLTLRNYWISLGNQICDLINNEKIDAIASSEGYRSWMLMRNKETDQINNASLDRQECFSIEQVDNILEIDDKLIMDLGTLKLNIKKQRKQQIHALESLKIVSEQRS